MSDFFVFFPPIQYKSVLTKMVYLLLCSAEETKERIQNTQDKDEAKLFLFYF